MNDNPPPVDALLTYGEAQNLRSDVWPEYPVTFGLGPEHVPDLIRMATDRELSRAEPEDPRVWAPLHAWRALGQLRAEGAAGPLLEALIQADEHDDDWGMEELPVVFGMIGPAAIPALEPFLADESKRRFARVAVAEALRCIAADHPRSRDACVAILTRALEAAERNDPALNGFLISPLLDLEAVEAAPVIERAFATGHVDETISGGWEEVRYRLGLGPPPPPRTPWIDLTPPFEIGPPLIGFGPPLIGDLPRPSPEQKARAKSRRKLEKEARKKNRKRR